MKKKVNSNKGVKKKAKKKPVLRKTVRKKTVKRVRKKTAKKKTGSALLLSKSDLNPIIEPRPENIWESWQTFNPAAVYLNDRVHFLYRAIGEGGLSVLGYASSSDGIKVEERLDEPAYTIKEEVLLRPEKSVIPKYFPYCSGGSVSGCEDPRITEIEGRIYMTHTVFSNWSFLRVALASIDRKDFFEKHWDRWSGPVFISPPCEVHKNWVIFPERIKGKFAVLHSISPEISVEYFDSLEFDGKTFIKSRYAPEPIKDGWEAYSRGVGPPPIRTKHGWLVLYHAVDKDDLSKYKLGAMVLDISNPARIIHRSKEPVLEPDAHYENNGFKPGIVYSCGAVVIKGTLFVYYGGADSVVCVATAPLEEFVDKLIEEKRPKLKTVGRIKRRTSSYKHGAGKKA